MMNATPEHSPSGPVTVGRVVLSPAQERAAVGGLALLAVLLVGALLGKRKPAPPPVVAVPATVPPAPPVVTPPAAPLIEESPAGPTMPTTGDLVPAQVLPSPGEAAAG